LREVDRRRAEAQRCEAAGDPSAASIAAIGAEKAQGEVAYLRKRIAELTLRSPISGTMVTPDAESRVGDVLKRGQRILDVADLRRWEVVIQVPEADLRPLEQTIQAAAERSGPVVEFVLAAQSQRVLRARIESVSQISPAARPVAGKNVFLVRATIPEDQLEGMPLRVGYEGRARIEGPRKSVLRAAVDPFIDFLRMATF
jgi:multidrug resistance efflux pump